MRPISSHLIVSCAILSLALWGAACSQTDKRAETKGKEGTTTIQLTSPAFKQGEPIPSKYTCDGANVSPALAWSNLPQGTKSLALICDDPDAPKGIWVHWVIFNIPAKESGLPEAVPADTTLSNGATQGLNDFKLSGYGGPCPPSGRHRYFFKIYALGSVLKSGPETTKKDLLQAMEGHILGQGQLMGTYQRSGNK